MSEPFIAEIRVFGFNFAPRNWAFCNGQSLSIAQNSTLYSLIATYYGGDGRTTFNLPNLQGNTVCSPGQGPGTSNRALGQAFGSAGVTLQTTQIPNHNHSYLTLVGTGQQQQNNPTANCHLAHTLQQRDFSSSSSGNTSLSPAAISAFGGSQPHENRQPYLALNFCIALLGTYPQRP